ncbi:MAG TPA: hypothetical protein PLA60_03310 [Candidatus Pacearchaeota archaeon]|nr:hypothetical protein [Candidatus Pacearchaeota archaeon]
MGNYVVAGMKSFGSILEKFLSDDHFKDYMSAEKISNFLKENCNKFLYSYGQHFDKRKDYSKYNQMIYSLFYKNRMTPFFNGCEFIVDSGAFQISTGQLNKKECDILQDLYYDFLANFTDIYERAFILDIPLGPECQLENTSKNLYDLNRRSYEKASSLPDNVRDKIIYVHHFRTPKTWEIYTKILDELELFDKFKYHATGGIVINMSGDLSIPCIIYILPLVQLINRAKKANKTKLNFHILGGSSFKDVLFYELFRKVVKEKHKIDLVITYDSSAIFKSLIVGRNFYVIDDENDIIRKLNLRSFSLPLNYGYKKSTFEIFKEEINKLCNKYDFKFVDRDHLYDPETGTFYLDYRIYAIFYILSVYNDLEKRMEKFADSIYPLFASNDQQGFNDEISRMMIALNHGKITRKQTVKTNSIFKSLKILSDLDEDYCKYIVNKHLEKDEFIDVNNLLTF